jgi:MoxR-like ATPase
MASILEGEIHNHGDRPMKLVRTEPDVDREKFAIARQELSAALIERDDEIDAVLTALIANEHVLLVGPPGCAKSLLLDSLLGWAGGRKFSILLTKFSVPEEVCVTSA